MTLHRLTLLPLAGEPERVEAPHARSIPGTPEVTSITRLAQGGRWRTEAMRSYERPVLLWVTRGQGRITISGRTSGYGAHSAVFLPAGTMHGFTVTPAVLGSQVRLGGVDPALWPTSPVHLRLREVHLQRELTGLIDALERETLSEDGHAPQARAHHAGLLGIWFARTLDRHPAMLSPKPEDTAALRLTEAFTTLVEQDFSRPVGVSHFAARLGVTPTHLTRCCRQVAGRAALDLLAERRHYEACRLLRDTSLPVGAVASRAGYASPAYFTRAFRARAGTTPTAFREGA